MNKNLHDYRKSYEKGEMTLHSMEENPFDQFTAWFTLAEKSEVVDEVNAMTLSTIGIDGFPKGRVVLLKEYSQKGFILYTNYGSEKGQAINAHTQVCISFFWPQLEQQIIIKGHAQKVSEEKSIAYHQKRPRNSQLGALVSNQSSVIDDRKALEKNLEVLEKKYEGKEIPKPDNWGGYLIKPTEFEFWQGRRSRLHDRIQYKKENNEWNRCRLQP